MITITLWVPAAIAGGVALTSTIISNAAKKKAAKKQREQNLADELRKNEYNSPKAQMDRFRDANLNPNLMYSQGSTGNTEGTKESEVFQSDLGQNLNNAAGETIGQYYNFQRHKAGMDKIEQETRKLKQDNDYDNADYTTKLRHLQANAKNSAEKLYYEAEIQRMNKTTQEEERNAWSSGTVRTKDGRIDYKDGPVKSQGIANVVKQIQNINTASEAENLIKSQTTNQKLANKRIKEFEKLLEKLKKEGSMSLTDALQAAAYFIITK